MREETYFRQFGLPRQPTLAYVPVGPAVVGHGEGSLVQLQSGDTRVEVAALAPDLFRVGLFGAGRPPDYASEAVAQQTWPACPVAVDKVEGEVRLVTESAAAHLQMDPLRIYFADEDGRRFAEDDPELGMGFFPLAPGPGQLADPLGPPARVYKVHPAHAHYFGCGERTGGLEKTNSHQVFWNFDPPHGHTPALNSMYVSIPFVLVLDGGRAWGLFLDNPGAVQFDLAAESAGRSWFGTLTGDLVYYIFAGPTPADVLARYTELTGRTPMPPLWSLGYQHSRWGYRTEADLRKVAGEFRERDIPCDALYLDIDYMRGYRVFTWDPERFPDPKGMIDDLHGDGFHVVTIVDPGVKVDEDYPVYQQGHDSSYFCQNPDGSEYRNVVWPGVSAWPDFTSPRVREWWGGLHAALIDPGVDGIWTDMNEPTVLVPTPGTLPAEAVHPGGGEPRLEAQVHNLYGSLMARATREGLRRLRPDRRPFVITRAGYAGLQRDTMHWTGDNTSWWEHLWMALPQLQNLGLSGLAWAGVDIGGFSGDATGELLARWTEFGIFEPFCRNHSAWDTRPQEPWSFGPEYEAVIRRMLRFRQRLLPYLYTLFEESHRTGAPILRPLLYEYPADERTYSTDDECLLGNALLIAPITRRGTAYRHVYLPNGTWFHLWSGQRYDGPADILARAPLGEPAVYVRANRAIPLWPEMRYIGEKPADPLTLLVFPSEGTGEFTLYEDEGEGFAHEKGEFARTPIVCEERDGTVTLKVGVRQGAFAPRRRNVVVEARGFAHPPARVLVKGNPHPAWRSEGQTVYVTLPDTVPGATLVIERGAPAGGDD